MAGICSAHKHYDPFCHQCTALDDMTVPEQRVPVVSMPPDCTCAPIYTNGNPRHFMEVNWRESCTVHGLESEWYNSPGEVARRQAATAQLVELQRQAREARQNARNRPGNDQ